MLRFENYDQNLRAVRGIIRLTHVINKQNIHKKENESTRQSIFYSSNFLIKRYIEMFLFFIFYPRGKTLNNEGLILFLVDLFSGNCIAILSILLYRAIALQYYLSFYIELKKPTSFLGIMEEISCLCKQ